VKNYDFKFGTKVRGLNCSEKVKTKQFWSFLNIVIYEAQFIPIWRKNGQLD